MSNCVRRIKTKPDAAKLEHSTKVVAEGVVEGERKADGSKWRKDAA